MNQNNLPTAEQLTDMCKRYVDSVSNRPYGIIRPHDPAAIQLHNIREPSALDELMGLTGLDEVKAAIRRQLSYHRIMALRKSRGYKVPVRLLHMLLTGNPGTGKTTCARLIGRIYMEAGILSSGHMVEVSRASLVGEFIGHSEKKVSEKIEAARGGVLFIDEIYSLVEKNSSDTDNKDFGHRVLDTLMPVLSDPASNLMVIGAGYTSEMKSFLDSNPGLASRFPLVLDFKDFTIDELIHMAHNHLAKYDFSLTAEADEKLRKLLVEARKIKNFGNARLVVTLIENHIIPNLCMRLDNNTTTDNDIDEMSVIIADDIPDISAIAPLQISRRKHVGFSVSSNPS